jgi:hypothetical protein
MTSIGVFLPRHRLPGDPVHLGNLALIMAIPSQIFDLAEDQSGTCHARRLRIVAVHLASIIRSLSFLIALAISAV